jgi:hypothetical protein
MDRSLQFSVTRVADNKYRVIAMNEHKIVRAVECGDRAIYDVMEHELTLLDIIGLANDNARSDGKEGA